jgi:hypothetical protein
MSEAPMNTEMHIHDLIHITTRKGSRLEIDGAGVVRGADLSGLRFSEINITHRGPVLNEVLPRRLKIGREGASLPVFENCNFGGMRTTAFDPGIARFRNCRFKDVKVKSVMGHAHFIDCVFSGEWEGIFTANPDPTDPVTRVQITGNDFTQASGMSFQGGVSWKNNLFDLGGRHVIVRVHGPGWNRLVQKAESDPDLAELVSSLLGRGPDYIGQDWSLEEKAYWTEDRWEFLLTHCADAISGARGHDNGGGGVAFGSPGWADSECGGEPSGILEYYFFTADSDEEARSIYGSSSESIRVPVDIAQLAELRRRILREAPGNGADQSSFRTIEGPERSSGRALTLFHLDREFCDGLANLDDQRMERFSMAFGNSDEEPLPRTFGVWDDDVVYRALAELRSFVQQALASGKNVYGLQRS